ncbi:MAG: hypothetical protein GWP05_04535 [Anaerolineaceae bacterium]|nr:hypothetical protein [Anaerolineaceae bacterium]
MKTVVHVTHEALQKVGGIGAVLHGLCTSPVYLEDVPRNILVGPIFDGDQKAVDELARFGEVLYAGGLGIDHGNWGERLRGVQDEFGVSLIYGRRHFRDEETGRESTPEVLLVGISHMHAHPLAVFKLRLYETFGIRSDIYDAWDYEQYTRIALPAYRALQALGAEDGERPVTLMAHEYMGMPTALLIALEQNRRWRTLFYAHETATMRRIVERHPGHDTMFYNVLRRATSEGKTVEDVFGPQGAYFKHPLISTAYACDAALAVGDLVCEELRFLGPKFADFRINLTYNGIPAHKVTLAEKLASRELMKDYAERLTGTRPDYLFSHVTRMALSKGLWRDLKVLWHMERAFRASGKTAVLFVLSTEMGGPKELQRILQMESRYGWPAAHREGYPDLSGGEADFYTSVQRFNTSSRQIKVIFVNQFGWSRDACGKAMPEAMAFMDIRKGTDLEFGQSVYEPFGIAQLEPLAFGGVCVPTGVCGCAGFLKHVGAGDDCPNAVIADYTRAPEGATTLAAMMKIGLKERGQVEEVEARRVAEAVLDRLPADEAAMQALLESGYDLARHMDWDAVARQYVLPAIAEADARP